MPANSISSTRSSPRQPGSSRKQSSSARCASCSLKVDVDRFGIAGLDERVQAHLVSLRPTGLAAQDA
jgi:hypothetical protein